MVTLLWGYWLSAAHLAILGLLLVDSLFVGVAAAVLHARRLMRHETWLAATGRTSGPPPEQASR
ncbi:MAG: hypothetical protein M3P91_08525 [Actinomycetota bacterium]|nr:hypothetical protein [Actinomycetota bacterium]